MAESVAAQNVEGFVRQVATLTPNSLPEGYRYHSIHAYLAAEGHTFSKEPLTDAEREIVRKVLSRDRRVWKQGECFRNAFILAQAGGALGLQYAEGYAAGIIPVSHAWASINGKPLDVTWRAPNDKGKNSVDVVMARIDRNLAESDYFGITAPMNYVIDRLLVTRTHISILDDFQGRWPLLKEGFTFEAP